MRLANDKYLAGNLEWQADCLTRDRLEGWRNPNCHGPHGRRTVDAKRIIKLIDKALLVETKPDKNRLSRWAFLSALRCLALAYRELGDWEKSFEFWEAIPEWEIVLLHTTGL